MIKLIINSMGSKWDIEKFTGYNDLGLLKVKVEAVFIQQKCENVLKGECVLPVTMWQAKKSEMLDKASAIVLCLRDKDLRDVVKEPTATSMWSKLESLYMTKSLDHRQFLKQQLYSFKMVETKSIMEQLTKFNKMLDDLENIEDAGALVVSCWENEEGDVSHLGNNAIQSGDRLERR